MFSIFTEAHVVCFESTCYESITNVIDNKFFVNEFYSRGFSSFCVSERKTKTDQHNQEHNKKAFFSLVIARIVFETMHLMQLQTEITLFYSHTGIFESAQTLSFGNKGKFSELLLGCSKNRTCHDFIFCSFVCRFFFVIVFCALAFFPWFRRQLLCRVKDIR